MRLISQLINDISRVFLKLLKYSNGAAISTFFVLSLLGVFPFISVLDSNDLEFKI